MRAPARAAPLTPIRVLVADDHAVVRSSFRRLPDAQAGIEVVGEAANGREAVDPSRRLEPDVVLMDNHDAGARRHRGDPPAASSASPARVVILTTHDLDEYVFDALRAGACGFLLKHSSEDEVVAAVRAAAACDVLLPPSVTRRLVEEFARQRRPRGRDSAELSLLTTREREVLDLLRAASPTPTSPAGSR